jgi:CRISPR-associated protein (TIGR03984 family)
MALRKLQSIHYRVDVQDTVEIPAVAPGAADGLCAWLAAQAQDHNLSTLLAHADDGVIWGRVEAGIVHTSARAFKDVSPPLRALTLRQARLFGPSGELLLWRVNGGWRARWLKDGDAATDGYDAAEYYDEAQLLWGNRYEATRAGFTLVAEGQQGFRHAPPLEVPTDAFARDHHPLQLWVRHYLAPDPETGLLEIGAARLLDVRFEYP